MALVSFGDLIEHAHRHRYALSVFPVSSLTTLVDVLNAAQDQRAPVVLKPIGDFTPGTATRSLIVACEAAAQSATVPVAILRRQSEHPRDFVESINSGCNAVHITPTIGDFPAAVAATKELVNVARQCGIAIGGTLSPRATLTETDLTQANTSVAEDVAFIERTGVVFFEIHIGTMPKRGTGRAKIDFDRLKRTREVTGVPFMIKTDEVLTAEQIHRLTEHGVALVQHISERPEDPSANPFKDNLRIWGAAGRGAEVFEQCEPWKLVEHIIEFNVQSDALGRINELVELGRQKLATIPGVRRVTTGKAVADTAKYRYCWIVTFANRKVVDYYRDHPIHVEFSTTHFRPIAADRLTIDFEIG